MRLVAFMRVKDTLSNVQIHQSGHAINVTILFYRFSTECESIDLGALSDSANVPGKGNCQGSSIDRSVHLRCAKGCLAFAPFRFFSKYYLV